MTRKGWVNKLVELTELEFKARLSGARLYIYIYVYIYIYINKDVKDLLL